MVWGSIPGGVTGLFSDISPSDRTVALGLTQPLVKMSTRNIPGGKGGRCVRLTSPPSRAECHEIWEPKPPGTLWASYTRPLTGLLLPLKIELCTKISKGAVMWNPPSDISKQACGGERPCIWKSLYVDGQHAHIFCR
jgi:hypothetical protein